LFDLKVEQIEVLVHRQSILHSMIEFIDGSYKAQLSHPDMKLPIMFALAYPERLHSESVVTDWSRTVSMSFEPMNRSNFPCLDLAYEALRRGGTAPAAISAADEIAVESFLSGKIRFTEIAEIIERVMSDWPDEELASVAIVKAADRQARMKADEEVRKLDSRKAKVVCC
jgi:1-deoxy-D-xylulose-5-phosphate reductoisomerase